jgi:hypothetical protein
VDIAIASQSFGREVTYYYSHEKQKGGQRKTTADKLVLQIYTAPRGSTGDVRHIAHKLLLPLHRRTRAYDLMGHLMRRDAARVNSIDHQRVDSGGVQRH